MKYLWQAFLGLFTLGVLGLLVGLAFIFYIFDYYGKDLPAYDQLKDYAPPIVTRLYAGDGRLMAEFAQEKRVFVPIENIPELIKDAFIAAEDQNFYKHNGVDPEGLGRAAITYFRRKVLGQHVSLVGGSTITQQVVKNFLLTREQSIERKIKEAILATRMEKVLSKDKILELYLNQIYMGARSHGIAAAALQYFNKSLDELSIAEIAYLAGLPKGPNNYNPNKHYDEAVKRRNYVIDRMAEEGYITTEQAELAKLAPLKTNQIDEDEIVKASYFAEEVRRQLGEKYGQESLYQGGLAVRTTVDPKLQEYAQTALQNGLMAYDQRHGYRGPVKQFSSSSDWQNKLKEIDRPAAMLPDWKLAFVLDASAASAEIGFENGEKGKIIYEDMKWARKYMNEGYAQGPEITAVTDVLKNGDVVMVAPVKKDGHYALRQVPDVQGAVMAMDPHTGRVLAMQGGWTYGVSEFNRATQATRQPGSAFKPFVYTSALENGFTPATLILDGPFVIEDRPGHFWSPTNYHDEYYGPTPLRVGVEKSRNLMTVRLADYLGMPKIIEIAHRFGIDDNMQPNLSNALGAGETTLFRMTAAYAELVNGGKKIAPSFIDRIQDRRGSTIFRHDDRGCLNCGALIRWEGQGVPDVPDMREQIVDPRIAYQMVSILEGVVERGTAVRLKELGRPLAGKTGTTNESKDTWFMGFSPDLVVGVYIGFDEPRSLGKRETGSSVALPVFKEFMEKALKDQPILPFRMPNGIRNVQINAATGARAQPGDSKVIWEAFVTGTEPTDTTYILDQHGIREMYGPASTFDDGRTGGQNYQQGAVPYGPVYEDPYNAPVPYQPAEQTAGPGAQPYYPETQQPGDQIPGPEQQPSAPSSYPPAPMPVPQPTAPDTNVGTGGLY